MANIGNEKTRISNIGKIKHNISKKDCRNYVKSYTFSFVAFPNELYSAIFVSNSMNFTSYKLMLNLISEVF